MLKVTRLIALLFAMFLLGSANQQAAAYQQDDSKAKQEVDKSTSENPGDDQQPDVTKPADDEAATPAAKSSDDAEVVEDDNSVVYEYGDYWFPKQASSFAAEVDWLFYFIYWVSIVFFVIIIGVMVYFVVKYRKRPGHEKALPSPSHNTTIEILWSVLPSTLLVFMFFAGASGYFKQRVAPEGAYPIDVEASQFNWIFTYENGEQTEHLHMVVNRPVQLRMSSKDVLHSFFVPAFRQKQDVVPGRYSYVWAKPTQTGIFRLYCTEYCGQDHSTMKKKVIIHQTVQEFEDAVKFPYEANAEAGEGWRNGQRLYKLNCSGCHSVDGTQMTGPSFLDKYGSNEELVTGESQSVTDDYIMQSIYEPQKDIVAGFGPRSQMPSFKGKLSDQQIGWIIEYMKTVSKTPGG